MPKHTQKHPQTPFSAAAVPPPVAKPLVFKGLARSGRQTTCFKGFGGRRPPPTHTHTHTRLCVHVYVCVCVCVCVRTRSVALLCHFHNAAQVIPTCCTCVSHLGSTISTMLTKPHVARVCPTLAQQFPQCCPTDHNVLRVYVLRWFQHCHKSSQVITTRCTCMSHVGAASIYVKKMRNFNQHTNNR